jgi:hypothetical protein
MDRGRIKGRMRLFVFRNQSLDDCDDHDLETSRPLHLCDAGEFDKRFVRVVTSLLRDRRVTSQLFTANAAL